MCTGAAAVLCHFMSGRETRLRYWGDATLLLENGTPAAAVRLEQLWSALQRSRAFSLFCVYPIHCFQGEALAASLDYDLALVRLAQFLVSALADWCVVDVVERTNEGDLIWRDAVAATDPHREDLLQELQRCYPPDWHSPQSAALVVDTLRLYREAEGRASRSGRAASRGLERLRRACVGRTNRAGNLAPPAPHPHLLPGQHPVVRCGSAPALQSTPASSIPRPKAI
jgi:hypothetical protein